MTKSVAKKPKQLDQGPIETPHGPPHVSDLALENGLYEPRFLE